MQSSWHPSLRRLIGAAALALAAGVVAAQPAAGRRVTGVPETLRRNLNLSPFYAQCVDAGGFPILGSARVSPYALLEAADLIDRLLEHRPELRPALIANRVRFVVMAPTEMTTDVPEHSDLPKAYSDRRARGLGSTPARPVVSCGEENLLGSRGDPYSTENILIHEFSHAIHEMGMRSLDPTFDRRLRRAYDAALAAGKWKGTYAATNPGEYWAEGAQSWFDTNNVNDPQHNHANTRTALKEYDPPLARLAEEVFGDGPWRYRHPRDRKELGHLAGYDPSQAPTFAWPKAVEEAFRKHQEAEARLNAARQELALVPARLLSRSREGGGPTSLLFVNRTTGEVALDWLDLQGRRVSYGGIRPGETREQQTRSGHAWLLTDAEGNLLGGVVAQDRPGRASVGPAK